MFVGKRVQNYYTKAHFFDAYTDWYCIRREAFAAVLIFICSCTKLDRYEKAPPPLNTPAVVCLEVMGSYTSTAVLYTSKPVAINIHTSCSHVRN